MIDNGFGKTRTRPTPAIKIVKRADDPLGVVRVSAGGGASLGGGYYCTYRGKKSEAIDCLRAILAVFESLEFEPPIAPDEEGKVFV